MNKKVHVVALRSGPPGGTIGMENDACCLEEGKIYLMERHNSVTYQDSRRWLWSFPNDVRELSNVEKLVMGLVGE